MTTIEFAPDDKVTRHPELLVDFLTEICEIERWLVTDESSLSDFVWSAEKAQKVQTRYGVTVTDEGRELLWEVLARIAAHLSALKEKDEK